MPGGGMPGGGRAMPGGGMPGGGMPGGGIPMPGIIPGGMPGGGRMTGAPAICGRGSIVPGAGPPTPRAGPASPAGAAVGAAATGKPRPAALPMPGPVLATFWTTCSAGGGPSICIATTSSPRSKTRPSTRRSSRCRIVCLMVGRGALQRTSSLCPFLGGNRRNSSQSPSTRFMCRSNAINLVRYHDSGNDGRHRLSYLPTS